MSGENISNFHIGIRMSASGPPFYDQKFIQLMPYLISNFLKFKMTSERKNDVIP